MREWSLTAEAPLSLLIAADARLTRPNYVDDQSWELRIGGGEPPALALETSYGLRARGMRLFLGFRLGEDTRLDPATFASPPRIRAILPDYVRLTCAPFRHLVATCEYWAPESHIVAGRITLTNAGSEPVQPTVLLHAVLRPGEAGRPMSSLQQQGVMVLTGETGELAPLVFLSGGATAAIAPYPALAVRPRLPAGGSEVFGWAHAARQAVDGSFQAVRELIGKNWDAEIARAEQVNSGLVELETGDPDWDVALALAQLASLRLYVGPTRHLPNPAPVLARSGTHGYSSQADGKDYDLEWNGLTAAQAWVNLCQILPAEPGLAKGVVLNFLSCQAPDGSVDWRPGLGGQRSGTQSIPLLASLAWRIYQHTEDREFLKLSFARLLNFAESWRTKRYDHDQDGHPEWDHPRQAGFDDWPEFVRWQSWGRGTDLNLAETPDLLAYLYREATALLAMAEELERTEEQASLLAWRAQLRELAERGWSEDQHCYLPIDRDLHHSQPGKRLGVGRGEFVRKIGKSFDPPVRVQVRIHGDQSGRQAVQVFVHGMGRGERKRVERLSGRRFQWFGRQGSATSERTYSAIDRIEVRGLRKGHRVELLTPDLSRAEFTGLLPLWAGIPDPERARALIEHNLVKPERFWRRHGVPAWPADDPAYEHAPLLVLPNLLLGEGLVAFGFLEPAAELVNRLMQTCILSLKADQAFPESYRPDRPGGNGQRHHLLGVAPLSLFLEVLGVRLISPSKLALRGTNPFPWPVRLRWRGLEVVWEGGRARVTFPAGEQAEVTGPAIQVVERVAESATA